MRSFKLLIIFLATLSACSSLSNSISGNSISGNSTADLTDKSKGGSLNKEDKFQMADVSSESSKSLVPNNITALSVLPVLVSSEDESSLGLPDIGFTDKLITALQVYTQLEIETFREKPIPEISKLYASSGMSQESLFRTAENISRKLGGSPVLYCFIIKNKSMKAGGSIGSETPTDVEYRMWLYDGKLEQVVWSSAYRSKQRAVTENLFSLGDRIDSGIGFSQINDLLSAAFRASSKKLDRTLQIKNQKNKEFK